jgi:urease accessory protein
MSVVTLPSELTPKLGMHGIAEAGFGLRDGQTRLTHLHQASPLRLLFPDAAEGDPMTAALVSTSGGLVGGDSLSIELAVEAGARALVVAGAAEKVYRSAGADGRIEVRLSVGPGGWLEYLPQETILFEGARLRRRTRLDVAAGARAMAGEMLIFGRIARGETMTHGLLREAWEVRRAGRLIWADALHMDGDIAALRAAPAGFDGAVACATLAVLVDDPKPLLNAVRAQLDSTADRAAATIVNGVLLVRWLARDAQAMRCSYGAVWSDLRAALAGLPGKLPRLWHV